jgi:hypothetical protein
VTLVAEPFCPRSSACDPSAARVPEADVAALVARTIVRRPATSDREDQVRLVDGSQQPMATQVPDLGERAEAGADDELTVGAEVTSCSWSSWTFVDESAGAHVEDAQPAVATAVAASVSSVRS